MRSITFLIAFCLLFSSSVNSQTPPQCEGKDRSTVFSATCCKCGHCLVVESKPRMPGFCRECNLLCKKCRTELGDLNKALEDLKAKNRELNVKYQEFASKLNAENEIFYKALANITGEKGTKGWNLDGLYGSMGNFSVSLLSFASNFTGTGKATRIVNKKWFNTGVTIFTDGAGIYSTASGRSDYTSAGGIADEAASWTGTVIDLITAEFWKWLDETIKNPGASKVPTIIQDFFTAKGFDVDRTPTYGMPNISPEHLKSLEAINLLTDVWALLRSGYSFFNDLLDLMNSASRAAGFSDTMEYILKQILYNNFLMACIKETQDALNKDGLGFQSMGHLVTPAMTASLVSPFMIDRYSSDGLIEPYLFESNYKVDSILLRSGMSKLQQILNMHKENQRILAHQVFPAFFPWITGNWKKQEPRTLVQLLNKTKSVFQNMIKRCDQMVGIYNSMKSDLQWAVTIETQVNDGFNVIDHSALSEYSDRFYISKPAGIANNNVTDKWSQVDNNKLPPGQGRLNLDFPPKVDWSVDVYAADKFYTNRSSHSKHTSYNLPPGNYKFILNSIPVADVAVEKGKEIILKTGTLNIVSEGRWELYDESKKTYYTSGNKPVMRAMPVGTYVFNFEGKDYKIEIKDRMVLKFRERKPLVVEQ